MYWGQELYATFEPAVNVSPFYKKMLQKTVKFLNDFREPISFQKVCLLNSLTFSSPDCLVNFNVFTKFCQMFPICNKKLIKCF